MTMQQMGIIVLVVAFVALIYVEVQKRAMFAKLEHYMGDQDYESCIALLDKPLMRILYPAYNYLFMRLNVYMAMGDNENATRVIARMLPLRMSKQQELALAAKAFTFYVEVEDKKGAGDMLGRIEALGSHEQAVASRQTYEIFLDGSSEYIEEMEGALEGAPLAEQARLCHLLALQYENRGERERSEEYLARAERALKEVLNG